MKNNGEIPDKRMGASLVFYQNCLYLYGYAWLETSSDINDNSIYVYNITEKNWTIADAKNAILSKRTRHASTLYNDSMIIMYGLLIETASQIFDIWKFNFTTYEWSFLFNVSSNYYQVAFTSAGNVMKGSIYYSFFGRNPMHVMNAISYIDFSKENISISYIAYDQVSPPKRKYHCSVMINEELFIFGGVSDTNEYLNDMWRFSLSNNNWVSDQSTGNIPSSRALFGCSSSSTLIIIFGGKDSTTIFNDFYYYDTVQLLWHLADIKGTAISSRYSTCIVVADFNIFIIGGTNDFIVYDEIWIFSFEYNTYTLVNTNDAIKFQLIHFSCWIDNEAAISNIYVIGGCGLFYQPDNHIYKIKAPRDKDSFTTNTSIIFTSEVVIQCESAIIVDGYFVYVLFGSTWDYFTFPTIYVINYYTKEIVNLASNLMLFGHSATYYKEYIYVFKSDLYSHTID